MKNYCSIKNTKKSSAEQKPQTKLMSITRVQVNELLVASQQVVSCEHESCELGVYHIVSCQPTIFRVVTSEPMS